MHASRFPTTSWTHIRRSIVSQEELGELLQIYWRPIYAHIRRKGLDSQNAADLTQGFLTYVVLQRNLVNGARQDLGRFRTYLLTALGRYIIDEHRRQHGRFGTSQRFAIPLDPEALAAVEPAETDDPTQAFDRLWATTVMEQAHRRVESDCHRRGLDVHWAMYEARIHHPACNGCDAVAIGELAEQHGVDERAVHSMVNTVRRKLRRSFECIVAETVEDPSDLDHELRELRRALEWPTT